MNLAKRFGLFWYHFIVGDDWRIAAGVVIGLGAVAFLTHGPHLNIWWLLPLLVATLLSLSLLMATRKH